MTRDDQRGPERTREDPRWPEMIGLLAPRDASGAHGVYFGDSRCCLLNLTPALQPLRSRASAAVAAGSGAAGGGGGGGPPPPGRNFVYFNNRRGGRRGLGFGGALAEFISARSGLDLG